MLYLQTPPVFSCLRYCFFQIILSGVNYNKGFKQNRERSFWETWLMGGSTSSTKTSSQNKETSPSYSTQMEWASSGHRPYHYGQYGWLWTNYHHTQGILLLLSTICASVLFNFAICACRFLRKNLLLAGLWYGAQKPTMTTFLAPFMKEVNKLSIHGEHLHVHVHWGTP